MPGIDWSFHDARLYARRVHRGERISSEGVMHRPLSRLQQARDCARSRGADPSPLSSPGGHP